MTDKTEKVYRHDPTNFEITDDMKEHETQYLEHMARQEAERIIARLSSKSSAFRRLVSIALDSLTRKERGIK